MENTTSQSEAEKLIRKFRSLGFLGEGKTADNLMLDLIDTIESNFISKREIEKFIELLKVELLKPSHLYITESIKVIDKLAKEKLNIGYTKTNELKLLDGVILETYEENGENEKNESITDTQTNENKQTHNKPLSKNEVKQ